MTDELSEKQIKEDLRKVYNFRDKSEKLSWRRKRDKMEKLIAELKPYEEQILEIVKKKQPIQDKINKTRKAMKDECIHPIDMLVHEGDYILCKFCNKKIKLNNRNE